MAAKDCAIEELEKSLATARESEAAAAAEVDELTYKIDERDERIALQTEKLRETAESLVASKRVFAKQLEEQRQSFTEDNREQREALEVMETASRKASAEIRQLKSKVAAMEAGASAGNASEAVEAAELRISDLEQKLKETGEIIAQKDARIKRLEEVRLTKSDVAKLTKMKMSGKAAADENKELKKKLKELERRGAGVAGDVGLSSSSSSSSCAELAAVLATAAAAEERVAELTGAKETLLKKVRGYGARIHELETEYTRVRAAVEDGGFMLPKGKDLSEVVLEVVERAVGVAEDASIVSSAADGDGAAVAAAVAAAGRHHAELEEVREALRRAEAGRVTMQDQMRAGVSKFRVLEAKEASVRKQLEETSARMVVAENAARQMREAMETAAKNKEKSSSVVILEVCYVRARVCVCLRFIGLTWGRAGLCMFSSCSSSFPIPL